MRVANVIPETYPFFELMFDEFAKHHEHTNFTCQDRDIKNVFNVGKKMLSVRARRDRNISLARAWQQHAALILERDLAVSRRLFSKPRREVRACAVDTDWLRAIVSDYAETDTSQPLITVISQRRMAALPSALG